MTTESLVLSKLSKVIQFSYRHCLLHQQKKGKKRAVVHTLCHCTCVPSRSVVPNSCDPTDCSPPDSSIYGTLQARILEWITMHLQGIFTTQGWNLHLIHLTALAGGFFTTSATWEAHL